MATCLLALLAVAGAVQLALGLSAWAGPGAALVAVHMLLGTVLVLGVWTLSVLGLAARVPVPVAVTGLVLGAVVLVYGVTQENVLPGGLHWVAQTLHVLLGLSLIATGLGLGVLIRRRTARTALA